MRGCEEGDKENIKLGEGEVVYCRRSCLEVAVEDEQAKCPIYCRKDIWKENKSQMPIIRKLASNMEGPPVANGVLPTTATATVTIPTGLVAMTTVRCD